jgi:Zn-dependent M28 family amino/carboxypeptidase
LETARKLIVDSLTASGWKADRQEFDQDTPHGKIRMTNILASFPNQPAAAQSSAASPAPKPARSRALVAGHYDTKKFSTIRFVGANDGASSTGALLELARVLAKSPALASKVDLVFFDGEEAMVQFTETDGLYGSRYFAMSLRSSGKAAEYNFGIVLDMIGDKNLTITLPFDSPKELTRGVLESARALGFRDHFSLLDRALLDDHVPLNEIARIPTVDLIDFEYKVWHTADDTMDQLSAQSLETVGAVTLHYLSTSLSGQPHAK